MASCVCVSNLPLLSLILSPVVGFRAHPKSRMISRVLITQAYPCFKIRSHSKVLGIRMWTYILGGHYSTHVPGEKRVQSSLELGKAAVTASQVAGMGLLVVKRRKGLGKWRQMEMVTPR